MKALPGDMNFIDGYCGNKRAFATWLSLQLRDGILYKKYRQSAGLVDTWGNQMRQTGHLKKNDIISVLNNTNEDPLPLLMWQLLRV